MNPTEVEVFSLLEHKIQVLIVLLKYLNAAKPYSKDNIGIKELTASPLHMQCICGHARCESSTRCVTRFMKEDTINNNFVQKHITVHR